MLKATLMPWTKYDARFEGNSFYFSILNFFGERSMRLKKRDVINIKLLLIYYPNSKLSIGDVKLVSKWVGWCDLEEPTFLWEISHEKKLVLSTWKQNYVAIQQERHLNFKIRTTHEMADKQKTGSRSCCNF